MRLRLSLIVLLFGFCAARAEEPRAVIERAVKAMGLDPDPARRPAICMKLRFSDGLGDFNGTGNFYFQAPMKRRLDLILGGKDEPKICRTEVLDGDRAWFERNGEIIEVSKEEFYESRELGPFLLDAFSLPVLFAENASTVTMVEEPKNPNSPYEIVVRARDKGVSYSLGFDKKSALLAGLTLVGRNVILVTMFSDYRETIQDNGEFTLREAQIKPADVIDFLRKQAADPAKIVRVRTLVRRLGHERFDERELAAAELLELDSVAAAALRLALTDADPEIARRARACLEQLEPRLNDRIVSAAIRQVVARRPDGAIKALLALLPCATEEIVREAMAALVVLAHDGDNIDPIMLRALNDSEQVIRSAAAAILGRDGRAYMKQPGRRLYLKGVQLPTKLTVYPVHGRIDFVITDVQYFNAFDPKLFAKP